MLGLLAATTAANAGDVFYNLDTDPTKDPEFRLIGNGTTSGVWRSTGGNPATGGYICITDATNGTKGLIVFPDFDDGMIVKGFSFSLDLLIGGGTNPPADGFSINYARDTDPVALDPATGAFAASPGGEANLPEEGTQTGLGIGFDTWDSGSGDVVGVSVRVDNKIIASYPMPTRHGAATDPTSMQTGPQAGPWTWQPFTVDLAIDGKLAIAWKNSVICTNLQTSFFPSAGRLIFSGRCGDAYENTWIDNIKLHTIPASGPLMTGLNGTPEGVSLQWKDAKAGAKIVGMDTNTLTVKVDGVVLPASAISYKADDYLTFATYKVAKLLTFGSTHSLYTKFTDSNGQVNEATRDFVVNGYDWSWFTQSNFMIEAEDFDYENGKFLDNQVLSSVEAANNYLNKVGVEGVDKHDPTEGSAAHVYRAYDATSTTGETVGTEIVGAQELVRNKYLTAQQTDPGVVDYNVGWVDAGEWWNYTRTVPANAYKVYARLARDGGDSWVTRFDKVTAGAGTANQTVAALGTFPGQGTGGGQNYLFFPLTDAFGNEVTLRLGGKTTFRTTLVAGGFNANFYMFAPVQAAAGSLPPYVAAVSPAKGQTGVLPDNTLKIEITDNDTKVNVSSIKVYLGTNLVNVAATATPVGASFSYLPATYWTVGATYNVRLEYADNSTTPVSFTNSWSFTVASGNVAVLNPDWAQALTSGDTLGFATRSSQSTSSANTTAWMEEQLSGLHTIATVGYHTADVFNYWGNGGRGNFEGDTEMVPAFGLANGDNFATETVAWIPLSAGSYTFGVNSDDGFRVTAGAKPQDLPPTGVVCGEFSGGRGVSDTTYTVYVSKEGIYPFRLAFEEGGGGYAVEWFYFKNGVRVLLNDSTVSGALKVYRYSKVVSDPGITFTQQPTNAISIQANTPELVLTAAAKTTAVATQAYLVYQWQKDGVDLRPGEAANITGVNTTTLRIKLPQLADAGKYTCQAILIGYKPVASTAANVTITADTTPPTIVKVDGTNLFNTITLTFSEPLDPNSATAVANYTADGGLSITGATLDDTGFKVILSTSAQTKGKQYTLTINGVNDTAANAIAANTKQGFKLSLATGYVLRKVYLNIGGGTTIPDLTGNAKYVNNAPDLITLETSFESPTNIGDNYGQVMYGFVIPPVTGAYQFAIAADDSSQLWLSTDDNPANVGADPIAYFDGWQGVRQFLNVPTGQGSGKSLSDPIQLTAGKAYFIQAFEKEGGGGDNLAVGWVKPGGNAANPEVIPGQYLATLFDMNGDTTGPVAMAAGALTGQATNVLVAFNENLQASAAAPANFSVAGAAVLAVSFYPIGCPSQLLVTLDKAISDGTTISYTGIPDLAANAGAGSIKAILASDVTPKGSAITGTSSNTPGAETVDKVIDKDNGTKYLNFDKLGTGFTVTPPSASLVNGILLVSANDAVERDPATYTIEGSNDGTNFSTVAQGFVAAFTARAQQQVYLFPNTASYKIYKVIFPTVVNAVAANSMQIAEVALLGKAGTVAVTPTLSYSRNGQALTLTFTGVLQAADSVNGAYTDVTGATSPATITVPAAGAKFYRVRSN